VQKSIVVERSPKEASGPLGVAPVASASRRIARRRGGKLAVGQIASEAV